jgi:hypothetical protein
VHGSQQFFALGAFGWEKIRVDGFREPGKVSHRNEASS